MWMLEDSVSRSGLGRMTFSSPLLSSQASVPAMRYDAQTVAVTKGLLAGHKCNIASELRLG